MRARAMVKAGRPLSEIIADLRSDETFNLTPFNFIHLMVKGVGMSLADARALLDDFAPELEPLIPVEETERHAETIFARYR
ncbi:hypothetical protein [Alloactinosynnema sp. L-07]|nr:hypothetical protein [Alloactinosynnema sp. L-07]